MDFKEITNMKDEIGKRAVNDIKEYSRILSHLLKEVNKIIRNKKTTDDEKRVKIKDLGFSDDTVKRIMGRPTHVCQIKGFDSYVI